MINLNSIDIVQYKSNQQKKISVDKYKKIDISEFHMLKVLGRGSFGKVMLVEKKTSRRLYAMKILSKESI